MMRPELLLIAAGGAAAVAFFGVAWIWKRFQPAKEKAQSVSNRPPPSRIKLVQQEMPVWKGEKFIAGYAAHFKSLGFHAIAAYRIPELDNQGILALFHPGQKFYACVYDSKTTPSFEIFAAFSTDNSLVGTNSVWARDMEQRPGNTIVRLPNATPAQVLEALRQHEKAADRIGVTADQFVPVFLRGYIQNFNWRMKKGDTTRDQIRMDARQEGRALTREQTEEIYHAKRVAYVTQLQDACRMQYRDENKLDDGEWIRLQGNLIAIPESYDLKEVIGAVSHLVPGGLNEEQLFALQRVDMSLGDDGISLITKIISRNIGELRLKQIGHVKEPVRAWLVGIDDTPAESEAEDVIPAPDQLEAAA